MAVRPFLARLRGADRSEALLLREASSELAALAFIEAEGMVVDVPGAVTVLVRDVEIGLDLSFEIDLEPAVRRKAA